MQFKIPQNVQIEDRIVGPLTLRHMIIVGAGGGFAYLLYVILSRTYYAEVWVPPVVIVLLITAAFAFLKVYNVNFSKFIILFIEFYILPRKRRWIKSSAEVFLQQPLSQKSTAAQKKAGGKARKPTMDNLKDISKVLDTYGDKIESYDSNKNNK